VEQSCSVSFAQQRLWFLEQLEQENSAYNLVSAIRIRGILDIDALARALQAIVQRHDSLRTTFNAVDGHVMASVCAVAPVDLGRLSLDHLPEDQREQHALVLAVEEGQRRFNLSTGPLLRVKLLRLSLTEHLLVLTMHHIVADGWSIGVLLKEMAELYKAFLANCSPEIPALPIQYSDFACWQRESVTGEVQTRQLEYWKRTLGGAPAVLELPADRPRPAVQSHQGHRHSVRLDAELAKDVIELSRRERVTPFMVLLATFETLLWRYTGIADFVLGTPMAGRSHFELEPLIGLFVNTIPLRANLSGNPSFRTLLHRVRDKTIDAMAHQDVPFEKIVEELRPERSMSHTPLFQTMFIMHNSPRTSLDFAGIHLDELELDSGLAKFDLTVETMFESDELCCAWEYTTDLFDHRRIARMAQHYETLLRGICADPGRTLSELPILGLEERNKVLLEWNATESAFPDGICIHEAFEVQAARSANSIAIRGDDRHLTFQQLNDEANCLSHYLQRLGVQPEDRIGVALERSADAIVALLAVMKTGASYVPIDPAYPKQRIEFMLKDSGARVLITQHRLRMRLPEHGGQTVFMDSDRASILVESRLNPQVSLNSGYPAYVIYTSGSTGNPKGVLGTHRASMNRFAWMWRAYPFQAGEVCAQKTSLSFVDSIAEIFGPLLQGVSILVVPDETVIDPDELVRQLAAQRVTRIVVVPSQLGAILDGCPRSGTWLPTLRFCFTSGEALPHSLYERFTKLVPQATLVNLYGSSEVAADVTCFDASSTSPRGFVPIGKPIANVRVYVLDSFLNPVPIGVPGDIHVAGDCLARGYLDRPELTAERFIADPFRPGGLLYKTGDLGCFHEDGNIEFLGRRDNQVKIRGLRIELGEIESALATHDSVRHSAVVVSGDEAANHLLVAYIVPAKEHTVIQSELRRHLKTKLPDYMVPTAFVTIDALPTTPNGKLDLRALPPFDAARRQSPDGYVAPRNELEETLVAIWAEVLKVDRIGVLDNFFELGGHSLMVAQVIARVRKYTGVEVPVRSLFEEPTVASLAAAVERARADGATPGMRLVPGRSLRQTREQLEMRLRELSDEEIDGLLTTALARRAQEGSQPVD
jgi:amino acid adenylation domain-containing protein